MFCMFETARLIIRHFKPEDWENVQELAISKENDEFADCDDRWPTSDDDIKGMTQYLATDNDIWAFELKSEKKVICFVNFNSFNEGILNIGHVMNAKYCDQGLEEEGLKELYLYAFNEMGAKLICATWAFADKKKTGPLYNLNMKVTKKFMANKFTEGSTEQFEACSLEVTKDEFMKIV